ncbi:MAG: N-acetylmuramoyl-L-alanine amidase [Defluviitaleaceae bacterium]|nr:N-acetylmuramoyl-L-alanine amidase [Defluviitaleaceae bacterium]
MRKKNFLFDTNVNFRDVDFAPNRGNRWRALRVFFCAIFIFFVLSVNFYAYALPLSKKIIVIDAGHGGWDPGKVQCETEEKHINLCIAKKLQTFLEQSGATVFITRADDEGLGKTKTGDMKARRNIANTSHADIFVSIHQNSFRNTKVHGAQTFFYNSSDNSQKLATSIQNRLREFADPQNKFNPKENDNYFVLKQTEMPAVLVECGFMTNQDECGKLQTDAYQEKIAWSIYLGIVDYFCS